MGEYVLEPKGLQEKVDRAADDPTHAGRQDRMDAALRLYYKMFGEDDFK